MTDDPFVQRVKKLLVPRLKQQQFSGKFRRFTRTIGQLIHEVSIAGTRHGGERSITLGIGFDFLAGISSFDRGIEYCFPLVNCTFKDGWWRYNRESVSDCEEKADNMIHCYHSNADAFFAKYLSFPGSFEQLTPYDLENAPASFLPPRPFRNVSRDCLVLMNLWHFLGHGNRAREFALAGLTHVGNAVTLRSSFENYIATAII